MLNYRLSRRVSRVLFGACVSFASSLFAAPTIAATTTTTFNVTATVVATCQVSATPLAFGNYSGALTNNTSTITATCTNTSPYNIGLNAGTATGATVTARKMTGPAAALLNYNLYSNAGMTTNWGNTVGTDTVTGTGSGTAHGRGLPVNTLAH